MWSLPGMTKEVNTYFLVTAIVLGGFGLLATWFLAGVNPRRPWDALPFVLSPVLLMSGLINWDLMSVAFVAGALWAWARDRSVLTGVMIGLGTAAKLYPLFLLGPILVLAWRRRRLGDALVATAAAAADLGGGEPPRLAGRPGPVAGVLDVQLRAWRRPRVGVAGADPPRAHLLGAHHQRVVVGAVRRGVPGGGGPRAAGTAYAAARAAGVPGGGRVPAGQQGVLAAVRALAAPARRAGAAALARPADLAGG